LNNLLDFDLSLELRIDGELVHKAYLRAGQYGHILGIYKGTTSVLPFKFQELELVGTFTRLVVFGRLLSLILLSVEDPDVEDAPVVPDMGIIELRAFRTRAIRTMGNLPHADFGLHAGRVSERSKKAGWHHVRYWVPKPPILFPDEYPLIFLPLQHRR
jgi:hypothetical protein